MTTLGHGGDPAGVARLPRLALTVMAASVFAAITTEVLPVGLLPVMSADLHTSESRVGLLVSAYALVVAVGSVPVAAVTARWPRRITLGALLGVYTLSNVVMATASGYPVALAARLVGGLAHAGFFGAVFAAAVSIVAPERTGKAVAFVGAGTVLALSFGVPLGTALGNQVGWRWAFAACAVLMAVLAVLLPVVLPDTARTGPPSAGQVPLLRAVRSRPVVVVAVVTAVLTLGHYTPYTYVSVLLLHAGVATTQSSIVLSGYGFASIVGLIIASRVVDRRPVGALLTTIAVVTACLLVLGTAPGAAPAVAAVVVWGLALGGLPTLVQAVALRSVPSAPDAAPAVVNSMFNVGIAGGALVGATELAVTGPTVLPLTGAALVAASAVILRLLR
jgi:MFS transporter, DHA1 family, inner membrane transport protein